MSAIGAIFDTGGVNADEAEALGKSLAVNPHDDAGIVRHGTMALVACTYHTDGESRQQAQPLRSADGQLAAVFDGYLANPDEVAHALENAGVRLPNRSDVALALYSYETWGDACANRLHGEFAFIIADWRQGRLYAARDHIGVVPLFYRQERPGRFIIASSHRALASVSSEPLRPDPRYCAQIIASHWYLREETAWRGTSRLIRAHHMHFDGQRARAHEYWRVPTDITIRYKSDADYAAHYREVLFDSMRRAARSDRSIGVALSGGLDSSALFAIADRLERDGTLLAPGFLGYSLSAPDGSNAYELPFARAVAEHCGRPLQEVALFDPDIDWYSDDALWHRDLPAPSNAVMTALLEQRVVEDGGRVLINGNGGDEWLQGSFADAHEFRREGDFASLWRGFKADGADFGWGRSSARLARQLLAGGLPAPARAAVRRALRHRRQGRDTALSYLLPEWRDALVEAQEAYEAQMPEDTVDWIKHNQAITPFGDLSREMMYRQRERIGVQARNPMLSRAFIEFSASTPAHIKRRGALTKVIHRKAMADLLPDVLVNRTSKANFTNTGIDSQFAGYVRQNGAVQLSEICDFDALDALLRVNFGAEDGDYWAWEIWGLYACAAFLYQVHQVN